MQSDDRARTREEALEAHARAIIAEGDADEDLMEQVRQSYEEIDRGERLIPLEEILAAREVQLVRG